MEYAIKFFVGLVIVLLTVFDGVMIYAFVIAAKYRKLELTDEQKEIIKTEIRKYDKGKAEGYIMSEVGFIDSVASKINLSRILTGLAIDDIRKEMEDEITIVSDDIDWEL